jgi:hypothetical protein
MHTWSKFDLKDVEVEVAEETANTQKEELDELMFEEDPEMYATAGLPPPTPYMPTCNVVSSKPIDPEAAIKNVMISISDKRRKYQYQSCCCDWQ